MYNLLNTEFHYKFLESVRKRIFGGQLFLNTKSFTVMPLRKKKKYINYRKWTRNRKM